MASGHNFDKSSEESTSVEICESDTPGPSSTSTLSDIKSQKDFLVHKISKFDTLAGLAIRYGVTVYEIKRANGLVSDTSMFARESIIIPLSPNFVEKQSLRVQSWQGLANTVRRPSMPGVYEGIYKPTSSSPLHPSRVNKFNLTTGGFEINEFDLCCSHEVHSPSEIELKLLQSDSNGKEEIFRRRRREEDYYHTAPASSQFDRTLKTPLQPSVASKPSSSSFSEYFSSMANSLMKQSEYFFGTDAKGSNSGSTESILEKLKRYTSQARITETFSAFKTGNKSTPDKPQGLIQKKAPSSDTNLSIKDQSKVD